MQMTESEIVRNYKEAKNKKLQIRILSDLNECEEKEIKLILTQNEISLPAAVKKKKKVDWTKEIKKIKKMKENGKRLKEIAEVYGVSEVTISRILTKYKQQELELENRLEAEKKKVSEVTAELKSWKTAAEELATIIENNKAKEEGKINGFNSQYKRVSMGSR